MYELTKKEIKGDKKDDNDNEKGKLSSMRDQMLAKIRCVGLCVLAMIVEMAMIIISIMNGNGNDTSTDDINKMITTAVSVAIILNMMRYVMSKNQAGWYHGVMIGGSLIIGSMRAVMLASAMIREYMSVMNIVMIVIGLLMTIASVVVYMNRKKITNGQVVNDKNREVVNDKNKKDENVILGKWKNGMIMNIVGIILAVLAVVIGWMIPDMNLYEIINGDIDGILQ
ncbi:hypothetical protein OCOL_001630 [Ordospora colligata]